MNPCMCIKTQSTPTPVPQFSPPQVQPEEVRGSEEGIKITSPETEEAKVLGPDLADILGATIGATTGEVDTRDRGDNAGGLDLQMTTGGLFPKAPITRKIGTRKII